ncbi:MAG: glycosyltransferase family protein [Myxococcota bacterium]
MRIVYGVHGYGRGHATRSMAVLRELVKRHEVRVLAGGDAYGLLSSVFPVIRIETLRFHYRKTGRRSGLQTLRHALPHIRDLWGQGPTWERVAHTLDTFAPDVVVSDAEAWTHRVAAAKGIPRISFDHAGMLAFCNPALERSDWIKSWLFDRHAYRIFMGTPERKLVSSFFHAPPIDDTVRVIPPLLRDEVFELKPATGEHLLVYLNNGEGQWTPHLENMLDGVGVPMRVYGVGERPPTRWMTFCPPSNRGFLQDLASCRAVLSTAGNQLVGESMYYGKAMLVVPEDCVEQRMNALALVKEGVGEKITRAQLTPQRVHTFLRAAPDYARCAQQRSCDGRQDALELLETWFQELTTKTIRSTTPTPRLAPGQQPHRTPHLPPLTSPVSSPAEAR